MQKLLYASAAMLLTAMLVTSGCGGKGASEDGEATPDSTALTATVQEEAVVQETMKGGRIRVNNIGYLRQVFNDSNYVHYMHAEKLGIEPITDLSKCYFTRRPIVRIRDCEYYMLDSLKHSMPYLIPEAAQLLEDIGRSFNDSLARRGGSRYKMKVTSLLRTPVTVKQLRRVNRNATDSSTHQFGTTFDISFTKFCRLDSGVEMHDGDLKNLLAEVLLEMRQKGRCKVKYERTGGCFHITTIK